MATILDRYGIKEVADVTFYRLNDKGEPAAPVLYLDTLKVSTIEQTAENTSARGGKGNPELIVWDYGKEITVTLEDALFSAKSMAIMFGSVTTNGEANVKEDTETIYRTIRPQEVKGDSSKGFTIELHNEPYKLVQENLKFYTDKGSLATKTKDLTTFMSDENDAAYAVAEVQVGANTVIEVSPDTFPGTYYITGDTYARSENSGRDEFFQFIIPKAKVLSEVTLTMEAEGDPSTFSMDLKVLRPKSGAMMRLVKYNIGQDGDDEGDKTKLNIPGEGITAIDSGN